MILLSSRGCKRNFQLREKFNTILYKGIDSHITYDIGLLKPGKLTKSGYRLYDDEALQKLQQILFFKELGFKLREIKEILQKPDFDRIAAFKKQKEMLLLKRNRTDRLIQLLCRLDGGWSEWVENFKIN